MSVVSIRGQRGLSVFSPVMWCVAGVLLGGAILWGRDAVLGIFAVGLLVVILHTPRVGLTVIIGLMLTFASPGLLGGRVGMAFCRVVNVLLIVTSAACLWHVLTRRQQLVIVRPVLLSLVLSGLVLAIRCLTPASTTAWLDTRHLFAVVLLFCLTVQLVRTPAHVERMMQWLCWIAVFASAVALLQYLCPSYQVDTSTFWLEHDEKGGAGVVESLESSNLDIVRVSGTLWHSNWLAIFLVTTLPLNLYCWRRSSSVRQQSWVLVSVSCQLAALVLTFTRMGVLGLLCILTAALGKRLLKPSRVIPTLLLLALLAFPLLPAGFKERIFSPAQYKASDSISSRSLMLQVGWDLFKDHWLIGVGWGNFGYAFQQRSSWLADRFSQFEGLGAAYDPNDLGAHNMYLELAVETGIVGLFLWLGLLVVTFRGCREVERVCRFQGHDALSDMAAVLQISLLGFMVVALFLHAQEQKILWIVLGLCVALTAVVKAQHQPVKG